MTSSYDGTLEATESADDKDAKAVLRISLGSGIYRQLGYMGCVASDNILVVYARWRIGIATKKG